MAFDFGPFTATVPDGWTVGEDDDLIAVYPPAGDSYIQVSTYRAGAGHVPTADELWEFSEESLEPTWNVSKSSIWRDGTGCALDAEGPTEVGGALLAFRLWPGQLIFATFYYSPDSARHVEAARALLSSIEPSRDNGER
jgi:hypothetical protein